MKFANILTVGLVLTLPTCMIAPEFITETVEVKVTGKERHNTSQSSYYLVYTDKTTYTLKDSVFDLNFDTSDDYGKLNVDSCYELYVRGLRVPILSMYQNIGDITPVNCQ